MNIFDHTSPKTGEEFTTLLEHKNVRIVRIVSSNDIEPIDYVQDEDEWVMVVEGGATLNVDGERVTLNQGDTLFIPAHTPHTVTATQHGTIWLAVHISP
jgi:cupin 2 domain-containing protein